LSIRVFKLIRGNLVVTHIAISKFTAAVFTFSNQSLFPIDITVAMSAITAIVA